MPPENVPVAEHSVALFATEHARVACVLHDLLHCLVPFHMIHSRFGRVGDAIRTLCCRATSRAPRGNQFPAVFFHGGDAVGRNVLLDDVGVFEDILGADDAPVVLCAGHVLLVVYLDPETTRTDIFG